MGFQDMGSDLKFGAPSGEIGMTSLPVIEKRPITPKPLQIGVSFLLTTNRKSEVNQSVYSFKEEDKKALRVLIVAQST